MDQACKPKVPKAWAVVRPLCRLANGKTVVGLRGIVFSGCCEGHLLEVVDSDEVIQKIMSLQSSKQIGVIEGAFAALITKEQATDLVSNIKKKSTSAGDEGI